MWLANSRRPVPPLQVLALQFASHHEPRPEAAEEAWTRGLPVLGLVGVSCQGGKHVLALAVHGVMQTAEPGPAPRDPPREVMWSQFFTSSDPADAGAVRSSSESTS